MPGHTAAKFSVQLDESGLDYLCADCPDGPSVCISEANGAKLIFLRGSKILEVDESTYTKLPKNVSLRYSEEEWLAFLSGTKDTEFDTLINGKSTDSYLIRDSKDPEGPVLVFNRLQMKRFIAAVKRGKYDI